MNRPLIDQAFQTDGLDLFVERYGGMINVSREGQRAIKDVIAAYLQRIDRDPAGQPSNSIHSRAIRILFRPREMIPG